MKNKIKQTIMILITAFLVFGFNIAHPKAATAYIKATSSKSTVVIGGSFTVKVTVSSSTPLGSWQFDVNYDASMFKLTSSTNGRTSEADVGNGSMKNMSYSYTFKALKSGKSTISIRNASVIGWDKNDYSVSITNASVKVISQAELEASYSSNNNLSALSVNGYELTPKFDPNVTSYTVELPAGTTLINVSATKADNKADVSGTGDINVVDGDNTINIVVTAENGKTKTYTILAKVKELNPIEVKVGEEIYTIVRKKGVMPEPINFKETTIKMGEEDVLAYSNEIMNMTIVGLKDSNGNIKKFIYDSKNNSYKEYNDITIDGINLYLQEPESYVDIPKGYKATTIDINDNKINGWKYNKNKEFYLIYGTDTLTGNQQFYSYDKIDKTLQRFNVSQFEDMQKQISDYWLIMIVLGALSSLLFILLIILIIVVLKRKKIKIPK